MAIHGGRKVLVCFVALRAAKMLSNVAGSITQREACCTVAVSLRSIHPSIGIDSESTERLPTGVVMWSVILIGSVVLQYLSLVRLFVGFPRPFGQHYPWQANIYGRTQRCQIQSSSNLPSALTRNSLLYQEIFLTAATFSASQYFHLKAPSLRPKRT